MTLSFDRYADTHNMNVASALKTALIDEYGSEYADSMIQSMSS